MSDDDEPSSFLDGDIVWVKLGVQWWPGEIYSENKVPRDILAAHKKSPIAIVKFFNEDTYEFVKNRKHILRYNNPKKMEFIRKGMDIYRQNNNKYVNKFPLDIKTAEELSGGDVNILDNMESSSASPSKKLNYSSIFGDQTKKSAKKSGKDGQKKRGRKSRDYYANLNQSITPPSSSPVRRTSTTKHSSQKHSELPIKKVIEKTHESRILPQTTLQTSPNASPGTYKCHLCNFTSTRQNVIVLHSKIHSTSTPPPPPPPPPPQKELKSILKKRQLPTETTQNDESVKIDDPDEERKQQRQQQQKNQKQTNKGKNQQSKDDKEENIEQQKYNDDEINVEEIITKNNRRKLNKERPSSTIPRTTTPQPRTKSKNGRASATSFRSSPHEINSKSSDETTAISTIEFDDTISTTPSSLRAQVSPLSLSSSTSSQTQEKKKQKTEKQNEIRSKLLADWMMDDDDDDDDDEDDEETNEKTQQTNNVGDNINLEISLSPKPSSSSTTTLLKKRKSLTATNTTKIIENSSTRRAPTRLEIPIPRTSLSQDNDDVIELIKQSNLSNSSSTSSLGSGGSNLDIAQTVTSTIATTTTTVSSSSSNIVTGASTANQQQTSATPKYRNIPKKDRRDVVLKDFADNSSSSSSRISTETALTVVQNSENNLENSSKEITNSEQSDPEYPVSKHEKAKKLLKSSSSLDQQRLSVSLSVDEQHDTIEPPSLPSSEKIQEQNHEVVTVEESQEKILTTPAEVNEEESSSSSQRRPSRFSLDKSNKTEITTPISEKSVDAENSTTKAKSSSISCFDFREDEDEDEDFLASISKLKKKYLSPDKNRVELTIGVDDTDKDEKEQQIMKEKLELEEKDKQLADDIEKLLNSTQLSELTTAATVVDDTSTKVTTTTATTTTNFIQTSPTHQEVRTLPPKERGKRIFKSRNRSRYDESSSSSSSTSSSSTSTVNLVPLSTSLMSPPLTSPLQLQQINQKQQQQQPEQQQKQDESEISKQEEPAIMTTKSNEDIKEINDKLNMTNNQIDEVLTSTNEKSDIVQMENEEKPVEGDVIIECTTGNLTESQNLDSNDQKDDKIEEEEEVVVVEENLNKNLSEVVETNVENEGEVILTITTGQDQVYIENKNLEKIESESSETSETTGTTVATIMTNLGKNDRRILEEDDSNYRNELAVAETLISIPSKLNDEMESKKSAAAAAAAVIAAAEHQLFQHQLNQEQQQNNTNDVHVVNEQQEENEEGKVIMVVKTKETEIINDDIKSEEKQQSEQETLLVIPPPSQRKRRAHMKITPRKRALHDSSQLSSVVQQAITTTNLKQNEIPVTEEQPPHTKDLQNTNIIVSNSNPERTIKEPNLESDSLVESNLEKLAEIAEVVKKADNERKIAIENEISQQAFQQSNKDFEYQQKGEKQQQQSSNVAAVEDVNFVEKYIKDAMMFAGGATPSNDDEIVATEAHSQQPQQQQQKDDISSENDKENKEQQEDDKHDETITMMNSNIEEQSQNTQKKEDQETKQELDDSNSNENIKMKLTSKQITEILDLRSIGMRADTPKSEIDTTNTTMVNTSTIENNIVQPLQQQHKSKTNSSMEIVTEEQNQQKITIPPEIIINNEKIEDVCSTNKKSTKQSSENVEPSETKNESVLLLETTTCPNSPTTKISIPKDDAKRRRKSRELMNLLQSVDVGTRSRSPASLDAAIEVLKIGSELMSPEKLSESSDIGKQNQISSIKEGMSGVNLRSFRPRKAKENIDARIRASLSPPHLPSTDNHHHHHHQHHHHHPQSLATGTFNQNSQVVTSSNNNSGLYLELIQAQKSTSLKDVIKNSKIDADKHRLSQSSEKEPHENEKLVISTAEQHKQNETIARRISGSSQIRKSTEIPQYLENTSTIMEQTNKSSPKGSIKHNKSRSKSISEHYHHQKASPILVEQSTMTATPTKKTQNNTTVTQLIETSIPSSNIKKNLITSTSSIEIIPIKTPKSSMQNQRHERKQSVDISVKPKIVCLPEQQQQQQQIILTATTGGTIDSKNVIASAINNKMITVENKSTETASTVRVPKKRKPQLDDIEDIPSYVIQKKPALSGEVEEEQQQQSQLQQSHQQQQQQIEIIKKSERTTQPKTITKQIFEIQQQQQQQIICKTIDDTPTSVFDINNLPILLTTNEAGASPTPATATVLHTGGGIGGDGVHIVITPHSNQTITPSPTAATAATLIPTASAAALPPSEPTLITLPKSSPSTVATATETVIPASTNNKTTKKKTFKQVLTTITTPTTSNQTITSSPENIVTAGLQHNQHNQQQQQQQFQHHHHSHTQKTSSIKTKSSTSKLIIQEEPKQIGIDGKGNKFVIVRSENGAKMIIQRDTTPPPITVKSSNKRKETQQRKKLTQSSSSISPQQNFQQQSQHHQSTTTIASSSSSPSTSPSSSKNIVSTDKASVISTQIISPTAGKNILSKATAGPTISVGTDPNLVITSKGNVYSSSTIKQFPSPQSKAPIQSSVSVTQICNVMSSSSASSTASVTASSLTRRLSRQGTTLQPVTGDRIAARQQQLIEEPPKVIIQQKTIIDDMYSPPPPPQLLHQPQQQQQQQSQQLEATEISASEAAELTSRFGFIEVQPVQSPSPTPETTIITVPAPRQSPSMKYVSQQQQHKATRKARNKSDEIVQQSNIVNKFNVNEIPPLVALNDTQQTPSRPSLKRKHTSSSSQQQCVQQQQQTINNKSTKPVQAVQSVQQVQQQHHSPSLSPGSSSEKNAASTGGNVSSNTTATTVTTTMPSSLSKKINDNQKLLAVPGESFGGPQGSFYLCTSEKEGYVPVDNIPLFLDANNQLIPLKSSPSSSGTETIIDDGTISLDPNTQVIVQSDDGGEQIITDLSQLTDSSNQFILNTEDGQILLDQATFLALAANQGNSNDQTQLVTIDGQQLILTSNDILSAINQCGADLSSGGQILLSETIDGQITTSNPDILAAALASSGTGGANVSTSEVYHPDHHQLLQIDNSGNVLQIETGEIVEQCSVTAAAAAGITFQPINPPVTAQTSETNAILTQPPIMSTLEVPSSKKKSKLDPQVQVSASIKTNESGLIGQNLDDSLAVIGVTTQPSSVPSSLNLPITVTNPAIAPKSTSNPITLGGIYPTGTTSAAAGNQISPTLSAISVSNQEQELVAAGYELFTTSTIVDSSQDDNGVGGNLVVDCVGTSDGDIVVGCEDGDVIVTTDEHHHHQQHLTANEEEIVVTDFVVTGDNTQHHHHTNEYIVQQSPHHQQQISTGNFDDSSNNR